MVLNLEQISNENLVNFYKKELMMIGMGKPASVFFSTNVVKNLLKKGILRRTRKHVQSKIWITTISDMTKNLISLVEP
jgi:hypothetical protein